MFSYNFANVLIAILVSFGVAQALYDMQNPLPAPVAAVSMETMNAQHHVLS